PLGGDLGETVEKAGKLGAPQGVPPLRTLIGPGDFRAVPDQAEVERGVQIPSEGRGAGDRLAIPVGESRQRAVRRAVGAPRLRGARDEAVKPAYGFRLFDHPLALQMLESRQLRS